MVSPHSSCAIVALAAAAGAVGKRTVAVNLAAAFAAGGRKVVLLRGVQSDSAASVPQTLAAVSQATQPQSIAALCGQIDAVATALRDSPAPSMATLAAPELFLVLQLWRPAQLHSLRAALMRLSQSAHVLLIDTPTDAPCRQAKQLGAGSITFIVSPNRAAITATYRTLKTLRPDGDQPSFQVIVNKARDLDQARRVFDNIAYAVRRYLSNSIDFLGYLPSDNAIRYDPVSAKTIVEQHPESVAAQLLLGLAGSLISPVPTTFAQGMDPLLSAMRGERDTRSEFHEISH